MKKTTCCIFNIGPHYRAPVYKLMDKELNCDFYFGDSVGFPIKLMNYNDLKGYRATLKNIYIPKTGFEWQKGAWKLIFKPYKYYIITGTPGSLSNWVMAILAILLQKKVYAWAHGMKGNATPTGKFIEKNFFRLCNRVLLYGEYSKKLMLKEGFKEEKLIPIYNSLDYNAQISIRKNLRESSVFKSHFNNSDPVLIYIGRIQQSKKVDFLVEAVTSLNKSNIHCNLVIVGEDVENNNIPLLIKENSIGDRVWMYGPSYDEHEISELLYNSDVCVTPGLIGLTAIHALTYGTPIITSDDFCNHGPEFEAIEKGVTGDFFRNGELNDLCGTICKWINLSSEKRNEVRQKAYEMIDKKYNANNQISILKNLIPQ